MLIVTDGAVDLPDELVDVDLVRSVPGNVWRGETPFTGDANAFWALVRRGTYPTTTPPSVDDLTATYRQSDLVLAFHVSSQLSQTMAHAKEAAQRSGTDVVVVDTRSLSVGAGLVVRAAYMSGLSESSWQRLVDFAHSLPSRLHTFALIQDVRSLHQSRHASLLPSYHLTTHHPLVIAVRGRVVPLNQPKNRKAAIDELIRHLKHSTDGRLSSWALGHGDAADINLVVEQMSEALGQAPSFCTGLDPTVGAHLGPDSLVAGAMTEPTEEQ